jgi:hypothetical protein
MSTVYVETKLIINMHKVLVDGTDFERRQAHLTDLELQKPVLKIARRASHDDLVKALKDQNIIGQYQETSAYKRVARQERRTNLSDFERFVARKLRKERANLIRAEYKGLLKTFKGTEVTEKKVEDKKARIAKYNAKQSFKNLSRKITKRSKAKKAFGDRKQKREQTAKAK